VTEAGSHRRTWASFLNEQRVELRLVGERQQDAAAMRLRDLMAGAVVPALRGARPALTQPASFASSTKRQVDGDCFCAP